MTHDPAALNLRAFFETLEISNRVTERATSRLSLRGEKTPKGCRQLTTPAPYACADDFTDEGFCKNSRDRANNRRQKTKKGIDNFDSRQWAKNSLSWRSSLLQKKETTDAPMILAHVRN